MKNHSSETSADSAANSERNLEQTVLEHSPFLTAYIDREFQFQYVNQRYADFHGLPRDTILKMTVPQLLGSVSDPLLEYWHRALSGEKTHYQTQIQNCHGELRWLDVNQVPRFDTAGNVEGFYCFLNDVTESREQQRFMELVFSNINAFIVLYDKNLKIRFANQPMLTSFGVTSEEVIGESAAKLLDEDSWGVAEKNLRLALAGERRIYENTVKRADGSRLDVLVQLVPEVDSRGETTGVCSLVLDISALNQAREQLQQNELRFQTAVEGSSVGILEFDFDRPDWVFADHVENLLGLPRGYFENSRSRIRARIHPDDLKINDSAKRRESAGEGTKIVIRLQAADGRYRWFSIISRLKPGDHGKPTQFIGTIADIDELKQAQLKAADDLKRRDEFLAMLSHELRNPMAAITFSLDCLEQNHRQADSGRLSDTNAKLIDIISRQSTQLSKLLQDLLDASRLTQNRIVYDHVVHDLNQSLEEIVHSIQPSIENKNQHLEVQLSAQPALVSGDVVRLKQALANLLDNASKYTAVDGKIWLETRTTEDSIEFCVHDSGFGIERETLTRIFELFFQAEQPLHRKSGGLGVGLYLVEQIVKAHGGKVVAASPGIGKGSQFTVTLPKSSDVSMSIVDSELPDFSGRRVMLVEDNADSRDSLTYLLQQRGFEVLEFVDGEMAACQLKTLQFDVAIIDIGLPGQNGLELAKLIRRESHLTRSILLAMTGYNQPVNQSPGTQFEFDAHLVKPIKFSKLCFKIKELLDLSTPR